MESASTVTGSRNAAHRISVEHVRSRSRRFGPHTHQGTRGPCHHELYVDDGALHSVEPDPDQGYLVKTATAHCTSSVAVQPPRGNWGSNDTWVMPCQNGDFEITTTWRPESTRHTAKTPKEDRKAPADMVLNELRPISRSQRQAFADIANFRNHSESYNNWYKNTLPRHGRAASLSADGQALDYLAGACLLNAIAWTRYQHEE